MVYPAEDIETFKTYIRVKVARYSQRDSKGRIIKTGRNAFLYFKNFDVETYYYENYDYMGIPPCDQPELGYALTEIEPYRVRFTGTVLEVKSSASKQPIKKPVD